MDVWPSTTSTISTEPFDADSGAGTLLVTPRFQSPVASARSQRNTISTDAIPSAVTGAWGAIARANMSTRMFGQIVRLSNAPDGWAGVNSKALSAAAILRFLDFWQLVRDQASEPSLTLAPDGSLVAEWFKSTKQRLDVRFSLRGAIFGLITPKNILEGVESAETAATILKVHPQRPLSWGQGA